MDVDCLLDLVLGDFECLIAFILGLEVTRLEVMQEGTDFGSLLSDLILEVVSFYFLASLLVLGKELLG